MKWFFWPPFLSVSPFLLLNLARRQYYAYAIGLYTRPEIKSWPDVKFCAHAQCVLPRCLFDQCLVNIFFLASRVEDHAFQMMNLFLECGLSRLVCLYVLYVRAVFSTEFCFSRLQQMVASKISTHFQSLSTRVIFWGFYLNQSQCTKPKSRNGYGRTERNLHSYMAEFIKLVNGYNTFSIGTKVSRQ